MPSQEKKDVELWNPVNTLFYMTKENRFSPQLALKWRNNLWQVWFLSFDVIDAYNRKKKMP